MPSADCVEKWCQDRFLNCAALRMADAIRAELVETVRRIELPYAEPAFGSRENTLNIQRALLSGFFMQVRAGTPAGPGPPGRRPSVTTLLRFTLKALVRPRV